MNGLPTGTAKRVLHRARRLGPTLQAAALAAAMAAACAGSSALMRRDDGEGQADCQRNLKQYTLGLLMYCQDYDERYPPMKTPAQVQHRVYPYIKNRSVYTCPVTEREYLPNPALNYRTLSQVSAPSKMLVLRDAKPHLTASGSHAWNVTFVDGTVRLIDTEPVLGKAAPTPPSPSERALIRSELQALRLERTSIDARIKLLERRQRRLRGR